MSTGDDVRADLERRPQQRGAFAVNEDLVLGALRFCWGDVYDLSIRSGTWTAKRRDGLGGEIEASLPDDLNRALREDWVSKPARQP